MSEQSKTKSGILRKIITENPCTRDWNSMALADKGRYCEHCKVTILDSPLITRRELSYAGKEAARSGKRLCVRIHKDRRGQMIFRSVFTTLPLLGVLFSKFIPAAEAQGLETHYGDIRIASTVDAILNYLSGIAGIILISLSSLISALSAFVYKKIQSRYLRFFAILSALFFGIVVLLVISLRITAYNIESDEASKTPPMLLGSVSSN